MSRYKFKIGDKVKKVKSYKFDSTVVGLFKTTAGKKMVNAEHKDGWIHIFREEDLMLNNKIKKYDLREKGR